MRSLACCSGQFDLAIVGGGIIGAGIARDASRRGLRVALLERADFGSGTTSGSTRLVHGGLRYLASADFRLVRLDLRERETLLRIAPHLVKPLAFVLPFFSGHFVDQLKLRAAMFLYDALSFDKSLPAHRVLDRAAMTRLEPALDTAQCRGGAVYYDAQVHSPERLALENVIDASEHGAVALTYAEVTGAIHEENRLAGVSIADRLGGGGETVVRAKVIVNASGPWFDRVAARIDAPGPSRVRMTKGVHVACEAFTSQAIVLESAVDGRIVFAIPWSGYTWLGTTDTEFSGDPATAAATPEDIQYLVDSLAPHVPAVRTARRYWTRAGVRALARPDTSRMHRVVADMPGLVSVIGGKITGYRAIAEEVTTLVCRQLGVERQSSTADAPLPGGGTGRTGEPHLDAIYGSRAERVRDLVRQEPALGSKLASGCPDIAAQVVFSARHEWCERLEDFMLRRSYLGFQPDRGLEAADVASHWLRRELGWTDGRRREELNRYGQTVSAEYAGRNA